MSHFELMCNAFRVAER